MRITTKFVGSSVLLIVLTAILSGSSYLINRRTEKSLDASYARAQATVSHAVELSSGLQGQVSALSRLAVLTGNQDEIQRYERSRQLFIDAIDDLEQALPAEDQLSRVRLQGLRQGHQYLETLAERVFDESAALPAESAQSIEASFDSDYIEDVTRSLRLFESQSDHYIQALLDSAQEQTTVYSQQKQVVRRQTAALEALSFSLVILLLVAQFYGLLRPVLRSLHQLQSGAEAIGESALAAQQVVSDEDESRPLVSLPQIHLDTQDELQSVADAFNQMSQQLTASYHDLESKVAERTQSLNHANQWLLEEVRDRIATGKELSETIAQLQKTQLQLLQTEKLSSLNQLVAGVAHEINNPVSFIQGNLEPAKDYMDSLLSLLKSYQFECPEASDELQAAVEYADLDFMQEDFPRLLTSVETGVNRITTIVRSLQTFSHMDESETKAVDLHQGLDSALLILTTQLAATAEREAITVVRHYGPLPKVYCYPSQLNQVFMSLLTNAIDAFDPTVSPLNEMVPDGTVPEDSGPDGTVSAIPVAKNSAIKNLAIKTPVNGSEPTIRISTEVNADWVCVMITDNGIGMSADVRCRIFDPFFTTKPVGAGTGLGLSMSYQIVCGSHKGKITCQSEPGVGTTVTVEIPRSLKIQQRLPVKKTAPFTDLETLSVLRP